ncbi:transcription factor [Lasiodiplodia theobromae]|uniref:Transcription factor n=1 Tax=Lasiodiplodia theobromae TaxID=45133 RepID=A0A8H7MB57_9PEZI|nr:transcription factor [Lasiodiplodia theobromae]
MAFRISQDLGLQRGLKNDSSPTVRIDHEIRGRVYWGCYTSDTLISLILGRPVFFQDRDSVVDPSEPLPDNPELEAWLESGTTDYKVSKLIPYLKSLGKLGGVMHETLSRVFALKGSSGDEKQGLIHQVDVDLGRWLETLPEEIRWNRWWPVTKPLQPHIAALHLTFLCVRICIHRENMVSSRDATSARSSREQCESLIGMVVQLMRHYKSQHDLRQVPIIFVPAQRRQTFQFAS